jgi:thymidylate synthase ThyX
VISATILKDSTNGINRLTTLQIVLPRYILAQFNTHRVFSRNAGSSRAIPFSKLKEKLYANPVVPIWNKNQPGMQGIFSVTATEAIELDEIWLEARDSAIRYAELLANRGVHKQIVNRLLEPFMYTQVVVSSTEWQNFFDLRLHDAAQPEIAELARKIKEAIDGSEPQLLLAGTWHLPYITKDEEFFSLEQKIAISVARCARVSYRTFDTDAVSTLNKDIQLYQRLFSEKHLSPFEHIAVSMPGIHNSNFIGFEQLRNRL